MEYGRRRLVNPPHHPMCRGVDRGRHGLITFHLTQVVIGHGCFRSYLKRIGIYQSAECPTYPEVDGDVEYPLFVCPRFRGERVRFRALWEGSLSPEDIGRCLRSSQEGWDAVIDLATEVGDRLNRIRRNSPGGERGLSVPNFFRR